MSPWSAAHPGLPFESIDTPALVLDLEAFERNLRAMRSAVSDRGVRLRPHAKSHKTPEIARRQIGAGAIGICCQKVSEAAVFVDAGIADVLVTNEVVGDRKLDRLAALATRARIGVLVDHPRQVDALSAAMGRGRAQIDVYIEINVGGRCGIPVGDEMLALASRIARAPGLRLAGLQVYHGPAQHMRGPGERAAAIAAASEAGQTARQMLESRGLACPLITGAGTGTFWHERDSGVFGELQPGSYIFMDRDYADNASGAGDLRFEHSLFVLTTVMSRPGPQRAIVDAGLKASSVDSGMPVVWQRPGLRYLKASDEHGVIELDSSEALDLGDKLMLIPGHCDPTVNLYDELVVVRRGVVEDLWPISARGATL
jgi:D-serine deaminase-like pyridoxal phosphate-dependent protein